MGDHILQLKTNANLLDALLASVKRPQSAEERQEQRVSFVFGSLDSESSVTRERVREILAKEGVSA